MFTHLHTLSVGFFDRRPLGDTLSRLTGDVTAIENLVLSGVTETAMQVVKIGLFAGILFYLSWQLALVSLVAVPVFWLAARFFSRRIQAASRQARQRDGSVRRSLPWSIWSKWQGPGSSADDGAGGGGATVRPWLAG